MSQKQLGAGRTENCIFITDGTQKTEYETDYIFVLIFLLSLSTYKLEISQNMNN